MKYLFRERCVFFIFVCMITNNPIGLFDSGIGGTSIWKEIHALLPNENTIYLADSKNAPYGLKSKDEIIVSFLLISSAKESIVFWYCLSLSDE